MVTFRIGGHSIIDTDTPYRGGGERIDGQGRGAFSAAGGIFAVIFGSIFLAVGSFIALIGLKVIPVNPSTVHAPYWILTIVGAAFALPGIAVSGAGAVQWSRQRAMDARAAQHPDQPWLKDYSWDTHGARGGGWKRVIGWSAMVMFLAFFLTPFNYFGIREGAFPLLIVGIFDLVLVGLLIRAIYLAMQRLKFGQSTLRYERFPFTPGQLVELAWSATRGLGDYNKLSFTLRYIEERKEVTGHGKNRKTTYVRYCYWSDNYTVDGPGRHDPGTEVPISFLLPEDALPTRLRHDPPRYWELEMHADAPGVDFKEKYLVPVYAMPT